MPLQSPVLGPSRKHSIDSKMSTMLGCRLLLTLRQVYMVVVCLYSCCLQPSKLKPAAQSSRIVALFACFI